MKNLFNDISQEEKNRILNLHESATKRQYLSEQPTPDFGQPTEPTMGPQRLEDTSGVIIKKGDYGDPYVYSKLGNDYFFAKASEGDNPNWRMAKTEKGLRDIKGKIFNEKLPVIKNIKPPVKTTKQTVKTKVNPNKNASQNNELKLAKKVVGTTEVSNPNAYLLFNGDQLQWIVGGTVIKTWKAVSGLTLFNTPLSNWGQMIKGYLINPEKFSKDKNAGPTPPGKYIVGPIQSREGDTQTVGVIKALWEKMTGVFDKTAEADKGFYSNSDYSKVGWGNYRATITPQSGTNTYGRGSFYIHGGTLPGSHGCIDLTNDMSDFAKFYGTWSAITHKQSIPLVVNYKTPSQNTFINKLWSGNPDGESKIDQNRMKNKYYMDPGKI